MAERRLSDDALMWLTLIAGFILTLLPVGELLRSMWPYWVALVMVYWALEGNRLRSLGHAFVIGLLLDIFTGSLLGQHALSLLIISFLLERFRNQLRFFPPWQQAVAVMALLFNDRIVSFCVLWVSGEPLPPLLWWLAPMVGMVIWPWLFLGFDRIRQNRRLGIG